MTEKYDVFQEAKTAVDSLQSIRPNSSDPAYLTEVLCTAYEAGERAMRARAHDYIADVANRVTAAGLTESATALRETAKGISTLPIVMPYISDKKKRAAQTTCTQCAGTGRTNLHRNEAYPCPRCKGESTQSSNG